MTPDFRPGDPPPSNGWWNEQLRAARRDRVASTGPGLRRPGRSLARVAPPRIWALLSGSAPAYGFQEVTAGASGAWSVLPGGRTDASGKQPAYEANHATGLAGTRQQLRFSAAGDWRFQDLRAGSGGGTSILRIQDCVGGDVPAGLAFAISDGAGGSYSGTTEAGRATLPTAAAALIAGATPHATITLPAYPGPRWEAATRIVTTPGLTYATIGPAPGYACCGVVGGACRFPFSNRFYYEAPPVIFGHPDIACVLSYGLEWDDLHGGTFVGYDGTFVDPDDPYNPVHVLYPCRIDLDRFGPPPAGQPPSSVSCTFADPVVISMRYIIHGADDFRFPYHATLTEMMPVP